MIEFLYEKAYAKLNLSLDIISKMDDGYHNMEMVFQTVSLYDDIEIRLNRNGNIQLDVNLKYLPVKSSNIAYRAAELFFDKSGITDFGADISLFKRTPVCAGMGGGSADGAAVIRGLNKMFDYILSVEEMLDICRTLGSDVPFCLIGGTALGTGRGDVLTSLKPLPECSIVICKPAFSISTPELFKKINVKKIKLRPDTEGMLKALENEDIYGISRRIYNVFEDVMTKGKDTVDSIKGDLLQFGALGSAMTGTGSAVFGIFDDIEKAKTAYEHLRDDYDECYLTTPVNKLI